jgi:nucleoside-diphosphate-sugar epimerase
MRAIVTGGAGFIGRHLVYLLEKKGWDVTVIDDFSTHTITDWKPARGTLIPKSISSVEIEDLPVLTGVDAIFHLAGKVGPAGVLNFSGHIAMDTIVSADRVGKWADIADCPVIDISTSEVYGSPDDANSEDTPKVFREMSPRAEYAVAKLAAEAMLLNRKFVDVRVVRPFNVTGWGQQPDGGFVLPRFAIQALTGKPLTVYGDGSSVRAFTSVHDIVDGIWRAYEKGVNNRVYNLGNPDNACSIKQLAHEVRARAGSRSDIIFVDPKDLWGPDFREAPDKLPNPHRAVEELGWNPTVSRSSIIDEVLMYWRSGGTSHRTPDIEQPVTDGQVLTFH